MDAKENGQARHWTSCFTSASSISVSFLRKNFSSKKKVMGKIRYRFKQHKINQTFFAVKLLRRPHEGLFRKKRPRSKDGELTKLTSYTTTVENQNIADEHVGYQ